MTLLHGGWGGLSILVSAAHQRGDILAQMPSVREFLKAPLVNRSETLLVNSFKDPFESVSRINVANAVAGGRHDGAPAISFGSVPPFSGHDVRTHAFRSVSEAWQLLERAGLICRDLGQSSGDWWVLTEAGELARESGDVFAAIRNGVAATGV